MGSYRLSDIGKCHPMRWHIGNIVEKIRDERGIKQGELAAKAKMRPNTLGDLEKRRKKSRIETLESVADALEVPVSELYLELEGKRKPAQSQRPIGNSKHAELLQRLNEILDSNSKWVPMIESFIGAASSATPKGDHGPGRPTDDLGPGKPVPNKPSKKA
jgi:transcriptional regulator with XRE-family HTH domain